MKFNTMKHRMLALLAVPALVLSVAFVPVYAEESNSLSISSGANSAKGTDQTECLFGSEPGCANEGVTPLFKIITDVLLFIIGAVSVIMLIIGGIKYTTSQGDEKAVTSAKNTILYSISGIVVALLAYAAVSFVISSFVQKPEANISTTSLL